ncbi:MAG TPA: ATP-binding protein [Candidatus Eisenbacteria bacterium]|nr:ATP-binding protein [Candidatus Eisenbacteria bacterium]
MSGAATRTLRIPAEVARMGELRAFVRSSADAAGLAPAAVADLVQAVDEAATNIIVHGYEGTAGEILAHARRRNGRMEVRLIDWCRPFDPTAVPEPDLSIPPLERKPGGMGVHLMRAGADAVHHRVRPDGGNELTIVRVIDRQPGED